MKTIGNPVSGETRERLDDYRSIMQRAVQKAVEENRRLGLDDHQPDGREKKAVTSTVEEPK